VKAIYERLRIFLQGERIVICGTAPKDDLENQILATDEKNSFSKANIKRLRVLSPADILANDIKVS
jgi:hypothetical protein